MGKHFNESEKVMQRARFSHLAWGGARGVTTDHTAMLTLSREIKFA